MNLSTVFNLVKRPVMKAAYATGSFVRRNAPEILLGAGVVTSAAGFITAINAAPKAAVALDQINAEIEYAPEDAPFEYKLGIIRSHIKDVVVPFALPVAFEGVSLTCFLTSYGVLKRRHAALALAYQALDLAFTQYRQRVIADLGPEKDYYYRTGIIESTCQVVDENGNVTEQKGKILNDNSGHSIYARYFDENSTLWKKSPYWNMMCLRAKEKEWKSRLIQRGHIFLNEVYRDLGLPETAEGQVVGWINDPEIGSCDVDFGITQGFRLAKHLTDHNIYESAILLDFNVDGPIYEYLNIKNARHIALVTPHEGDKLPEYYPTES